MQQHATRQGVTGKTADSPDSWNLAFHENSQALFGTFRGRTRELVVARLSRCGVVSGPRHPLPFQGRGSRGGFCLSTEGLQKHLHLGLHL